MSDPVLVARSRLARASRVRNGDPEYLALARRAFCEAKLSQDIGFAIQRWGPLTADQRARLAAQIITGGDV